MSALYSLSNWKGHRINPEYNKNNMCSYKGQGGFIRSPEKVLFTPLPLNPSGMLGRGGREGSFGA